MRITLVGFGTIGIGVARALADRAEELRRRGLKMKLVAVVDSHSAAVSKKGLNPLSVVTTKKSTGSVGELRMNALEVISEVKSDVIVELTPGNPKNGEPGLSHIREALKASRSVVVANKMPLAIRYAELVDGARRRGVRVLYGACVGGGLPILEMGRACAEAEPVLGIDGVLNATSNFILTKMEEAGAEYDSAIAEAQRLGYAETDPTLDVCGHDAACKLVILANHVMGSKLSLKDVDPLEGIEGISKETLRQAAARGEGGQTCGKDAPVPPGLRVRGGCQKPSEHEGSLELGRLLLQGLGRKNHYWARGRPCDNLSRRPERPDCSSLSRHVATGPVI